MAYQKRVDISEEGLRNSVEIRNLLKENGWIKTTRINIWAHNVYGKLNVLYACHLAWKDRLRRRLIAYYWLMFAYIILIIAWFLVYFRS